RREPCGSLGLARRAARRADRGARGRADGDGLRPRAAPARPGPRCRRHLAQHGRRLRGRRSHRRAAARSQRGRVHAVYLDPRPRRRGHHGSRPTANGEPRMSRIGRILAGLPLPRSSSALTVIVGLVVVWGLFQLLNDNFLSPRNLSNLLLQIAVLGTLAIGMVLVLVIGEIDLSVGAIAGVSAATLAIAVTQWGVPAALAILIALVVG